MTDFVDKTVVASYYQQSVDWSKYYSVVDTVGITLNGRKDRFEKSDIFEQALDVFSDGKIKYVNNEGADHHLPELGDGVFCEMKYGSNSLYKLSTKKGVQSIVLRDRVTSLRLVNTLGNGERHGLPSAYAPYVLVSDYHGSAVIDTATLSNYLEFGQGHIEAKNVPMEHFVHVVTPNDNVERKVIENFNYKEEKQKFQNDFLKKF